MATVGIYSLCDLSTLTTTSLPSIGHTLKDPPPAYTYDEISRPPSSILTGISSATLTSNAAPHPDFTFPLAFNLYVRRPALPTGLFHLGEHLDQPLLAVSMTFGWKGTSFTLHSGPEIQSPLLATATSESYWNRDSAVTLTLASDAIVHFPAVSYKFAVQVDGVTEEFEWRLSHGNEVRALEALGLGWKLVRLHANEPRAGGKRTERQMGETSDGKEVVAVWADNSKVSKKCGKFRFLGSGATGELGEAWALMAVVTVLRIWQNVRLGSDARRVIS